MGSKSVESRSPLVWLGFLFSLVFSVYFTTFFDLLILTIYVPSLTSLPNLLPASPRALAVFLNHLKMVRIGGGGTFEFCFHNK